MLDRGAARIEAELDDQPVVQAQLLHVLGEAYRNLGRYDDARRVLLASGRLRREHLGPDHRSVGDHLVALGWLEYVTGNFGRARDLLGEGVTTYEASLGPESIQVARAVGLLGAARWRMGDFEGSAEALERSLEICRRTGHDESRRPGFWKGWGITTTDCASLARPFATSSKAWRSASGSSGPATLSWAGITTTGPASWPSKGDRPAALEALGEAVAVGWASDVTRHWDICTGAARSSSRVCRSRSSTKMSSCRLPRAVTCQIAPGCS
jgi:hypothetical protein